MQTLSDYEVLGTLHEGPNYNVYKARELKSHKEVVLKATRAQFPSAQDIASLKREMELSQLVGGEGIIQSLGFNHDKSAYFLVQESISGITLKSYIKSIPVSLKKFLEIAIALTQTLAQIHEKGIIHKDIKPGNIIINPDTGEVKITDFSISSRLNQESTAYAPANAIVGTLGYISPEQTGRVSRSVDYRSDLYSLGATFYEMLSGNAPFSAKSPIELLCKHLTAQPTSLKKLKPDLPEVITQIIHKLLQKNAEDRYQSALGLKVDLERCLDLLKQDCLEAGFPIGKADYSSKFKIIQKLYGRQQEVKALIASLNQAFEKRNTSVWISGPPGIGKTALVHEVQRFISEKKGVFIEGKFGQYQNNIPYFAIGQVFNRFCDYLLAESKPDLDQWREKILNALKGKGQILIDLIPKLEIILGEQNRLPQLSPSQNEQRLVVTFKKFLSALCSQESPLTIFLDDMQWADLASLNLLSKLLVGSQNKGFLFIGAYRDTDVSLNHPLIGLLEDLEKSQRIEKKIHLDSLKEKDISQMISESLESQEKAASKLAQLVYSKTGGNPFYARQFLQNLYEEGLIKFSFEKKEWQWDMQVLRSQDFSESVVDLLILKINRLSKTSQELLQLAAALGNIFDLNTLASLSDSFPSQSFNILWPALKEGLIKPIGEQYQWIGVLEEPQKDLLNKHSDTPAKFQFAHDRIQEAAYATIEEKNISPIHLKIAKALARKKEEDLYQIVSHYQKSANLLVESKEQKRVAVYCLKAAKKAVEASAFENALSYAKFGIGLLDQENWNQDQNLLWGLYFEKAVSEFSTIRLEESEKTIKLALAHTINKGDKVAAYHHLLRVLFKLNRYEECSQVAKEALNYVGIKLPQRAVLLSILGQFFKFYRWVKKGPSRLEKLPEVKDPQALKIMELVIGSYQPFAQTSPLLHQYLCLWVANYSIKHGNSIHAPLNYAAGAVHCILIKKDFKLADAIAKSVKNLSLLYPDPFCQSVSYGTIANFINHWKNPIEGYKKLMQESYHLAWQSGEIHMADYPLFFTRFQSIFYNTQNLKDIIRANEDCYKTFLLTGNKELAIYENFVLNFLLTLTGKKEVFDNPELPFNRQSYEEKMQSSQEDLSRPPYFVFKTIQEYLKGEKIKAFDYAQLSSKETLKLVSSFALFIYQFFFLLSYYGVIKNLSFWKKIRLFPKVRNYLKMLKRYSGECPQNYLGAYQLVKAEEARAAGQVSRASQLYGKSIESAQRQGFAFPMALSYQLAAEFYLDTEQAHLARPLLEKTRDVLIKWGAHGMVNELENKFSKYFEKVKEKDFSVVEGALVKNKSEKQEFEEDLSEAQNDSLYNISFSKLSHSLTPESLAHFDFQAALRSSYAILGEVDSSSLIKTLMKIVLENSGGDRVCLILQREGKLLVGAEQSLDEEVKLLPSVPVGGYSSLPSSVLNYAARTKKTVILNQVKNNQRYKEDYFTTVKGPKSLMVLPVLYQGELLSLIYIENKQVEGAFTKERQLFLDLIVAQIAISLNNVNLYTNLKELNEQLEEKVNRRTEELHQLATVDALTGVYNRRRFFEIAEQKFNHAKLVGTTLFAILLDVDHFKEINDKHGHAMGDKVLSQLAQALNRQLTKKDIIGRVGGEEFAVLLPEIPFNIAKSMAERLRQTINNLKIKEDGNWLSVTLSLGLTESQGQDKKLEDLLKRADQALYLAKQKGRNTVALL